MAESFLQFPIGSQKIDGYTSDSANASPNYISAPSMNVIITDDGKVEQRMGYRKEFTLATVGDTRGVYHSTYDIAFFSVGTKVYYRDFNTNATYDTGITLTSGTVTRYDEIFGDIYLSNTTDGVYVIRCTRVNDAAANSGDSTITIDSDGAARIDVFGDISAGGTSDDLIIEGTTHEMASLVVSTGVVTLSGTLPASYSDNTVALVVRRYSSLEKASKILPWRAALHLMGFPNSTNVDQPNNSVIRGQFIQANANELEKIVDFTFGTGGSTRITIIGGGKVTNILGVQDNIYFFTENKVFATAASAISTATGSIGLTIPEEKDQLHGCLNEDCATVTGEGALTYVTSDKRIVELPIDTETGAAISAPREDFDVDIRDHLKNMSKDQTGAFAYHYRGGRQTIYQLKIDGQWLWFIHDKNIVRSMGSNFVRGAWQAPQNIGYFGNLFERNGVLYGADDAGNIHSIFTTFTDDLNTVQATFATGEFNCGNAMVKRVELQGLINQPSEIELNCYVINETSGRRTGTTKKVLGSNYSYGEDFSVGAVAVGSGGVGETTPVARWKRGFGVFPSEATRTQLIATNFQDGGHFSVQSYIIDGLQYSKPFSRSL